MMKRFDTYAINSTPPPPSSPIRNSGWSTKWGHRKFLEIRISEGWKPLKFLASSPKIRFPLAAAQMEGYANLHRVKFYGDRYRIVYEVFERSRRIYVTRIGPRGSVYSGFRKPSR